MENTQTETIEVISTPSSDAVVSDNIVDATPITNPQETPPSQIESKEKEISTEEEKKVVDKPKVGRPCMFCEKKEEYLSKAQAYLDKCKNNKDGKLQMPFVEELAFELNTIDENIVNWANKMNKDTNEREHEEFFTIYSYVKMLQKMRLKQRALGRYNPVGALSLLRFDHGAIDASKQILVGDKNEPLQITIVEEDNHVAED